MYDASGTARRYIKSHARPPHRVADETTWKGNMKASFILLIQQRDVRLKKFIGRKY